MVAQTQSVIKIKRSTTAGAPGTTLSAGELAYSGLAGTQSNGGDRLYIGINSTQSVIGGKYFTDMMSHTGGILQTSFVSALLTDAFGKIDQVKTTNLTFGGASGAGYDNSIRATNTNGGIYLETNGTGSGGGKVHISNAYYLPNTDGADGYVLTAHNDGSTTWAAPASTLTITADTNTAGDVNISLLSETLDIAGDSTQGISTTTDPANNKITISASDATSSQKGVAKFSSSDFDMSTPGTAQLVNAVAKEFTADTGSAVSLTAHSLKIAGDPTTGTNTTASSNKITITNTIATASQLGVSRFSLSYFAVDAGGEVTANLATTTSAGVAYFPASQFGVSNGSVSILEATNTQEGVAKFDIKNFDLTTPGKVTALAIYLGSTKLELGDLTGTNKDLTGMDSIAVGQLKLMDNKLSTTTANANLLLSPNGSGLVKISDAYTLPGTAGSDGYVLMTNGSTAASWQQVGKSLKFKDDSATEETVDLLTQDLVILGDTTLTTGAIITTASAPGGVPQLVISARTASTTRTGIASFSSDSFGVDGAGVVTIKAAGVSNTQLAHSSITFGTSTYNLGDAGVGNTGHNDFVGMDYAEFSNITIGLSADTNITGGGASSIISKIGNLVLGGNTAVQINTGSGSFTLPTGRGTAGYYLKTDAAGGTSWSQVSTTLHMAGDNSTTDAFDLINDTLTFIGDNTHGLTVEVASNGHVTFTVSDAGTGSTSGTKGVASFKDVDFSVTSGFVSLADSVVKSVAGDTGTLTPASHSFTVAGTSAQGIVTSATGSTLTITADDATDTQKGVASFSSTNFNHSSGAISSKAIYLGSTALNLGDATGTNTTVIGLTSVTIGDIQIHNDNVIENVGASSNISLQPGTGGSVDVNHTTITNVADPQNPTDAANRRYVDNVAAGLHVHKPAVVATTGTLAYISGGSVTYANGTDPTKPGIGAKITLSTALSLMDGQNFGTDVVSGDRILVKNEDLGLGPFANGVYTIDATFKILTRADDFNTPALIHGGDFVFVEYGTKYGATGWVQTQDTDLISSGVGGSDIEFQQFAGTGTYTNGDGIKLDGNVFSVHLSTIAGAGGLEFNTGELRIASTLAGDGLTYADGVLTVGGTADRITVSANAVDIASTYVGQTSITTLGTITSGTWHADVIGTTYGGTGLSSYAKGDLIYASATDTLSKLTAGNSYQFLMQDATGVPVWSDIDGGEYA